MTPINPQTDIPASINTLEKLAAWVGLALTRCNPSLKVLEASGQSPQRAAECVLVKADDNTYRQIVRLVLLVADDYATTGKKSWGNIIEFSNVALPAAFKTD